MAADVTVEEIKAEIADVTHPEIDATLVELGMIDDIRVGDDITIDVAIPMTGIPDQIKQMLAHSLADALDSVDLELTVQFVLMDDQARERFFEMEEDNWSGLDEDDDGGTQSPF